MTKSTTTSTIVPSTINGIKDKKYDKLTYCLSCIEAIQGSLNLAAYKAAKIKGVIYLSEGTCDCCHTTF